VEVEDQMKKITVLSLFLFAMASYAAADVNDVLSYVAMPLAVSSVCDVRGVQTDRVGELVTYMDQANVAPADFVDVFRYVPVALVMRTDGRPDFVQWVGNQVNSGMVGTALVSAMETQLRTYDDYVPVAASRPRRSYRTEDYAYAYEPDYVPVTIRRHCDRLMMEPLSLIEMPVAVANVYELGVPQPLVSSFAVELNLGRVPSLQFVELMRYAPAAFVSDAGSYGQPAFVDYVRSERIRGATGYQLVQVVDRRLRTYEVAPMIDPAPVYVRSQYTNAWSVPPPPQNWVDPMSSAWVPPVVRTRAATRFAPQRGGYVQTAPAIAAAPQVQRLLESPNGGAVVTNPGQARRELARANRTQREAPIPAAPVFVAPPPNEHHGRGQQMATSNRHGRERNVVASPVMQAPVAAPPAAAVRHGKGHGAENHGANRNVTPAPRVMAAPPAPPAAREHGRGHQQQSRPMMAAPPAAAAPAPAAPPPAAKEHGHGHGHGGPQAAAAPMPAPAPGPPAGGPPGQAKKNGKDKH
jgi:hypothetical protein